jgi:Mrp family chromosome partitioning ATPase
VDSELNSRPPAATRSGGFAFGGQVVPTARIRVGSPRFIDDPEVVRTIASGLVRSAATNQPRALLVTSCDHGEGKTFSASNMARALASQGLGPVLLVDANPDAPRLHRLFDTGDGAGLFDLLDGGAPVPYEVPDAPGLQVLPLGEDAAGRGHLLRDERRLIQALGSLKRAFGWVVADGPSVFGPFDASTIAPRFDGVIVVVQTGRTRWEVVQTAQRRLSTVGSKVLGVVMNRRRYYIPRLLYR